MTRKAINEEDALRSYIKPELSEKAPEGFTSRIMSQINLETVPVEPARNPGTLLTVPVVSVIVMLTLILLAVVTSNGSFVTIAVPEIISGFNLMSDVNFSSIFRINLPSTLVYVFIGLLLLSVFDRALHELFHSEK